MSSIQISATHGPLKKEREREREREREGGGKSKRGREVIIE